ncbi:MAG: DNA polymerase III subunit delta [Thermomicrobiales bacterium]
MIVVVLGPDNGLARSELRRLLAEVDPDGSSTSALDGKTASMNEVLMAASSVGFFSAGRVVVVEDLITRLGKQGAKDRGETPDWNALLQGVPAASTLILLDPTLAALPAAVMKALPNDTRVILGDPPRGAELIRWLRAEAKREGVELDDRTARLIAETMYPQSWGAKANNPAFDRPPDMDVLRGEIAKLAMASWPGPISPSHVRDLVPRGDEDKVFTFIDAAISGNLRGAVIELQKLIDAGEDPNKLLAQVSQQAELAIVMAHAGRRPPEDVGRELGLPNPKRMASIQRSVGRQSPARVAGTLDALTETDRAIKTGEIRDTLDALSAAVAAIAANR